MNIKGKADINPDYGWKGVLSAVAFAMQATLHTTAQATPSQLLFGQDTITNVNFIANWQYIKDRKQTLIHKNDARENARRIPHEYRVGDTSMVRQDPTRKHDGDNYKGPFSTVTQVKDNGTVLLSS